MKPLVLLDVDGVVNDIQSLYFSNGMFRQSKPEHDILRVKSHGHVVHIPTFMPELIQALVENTEVHWLTTWRGNANDEIADTLGIPQLPVVTDGGNERTVAWKPAAAYGVAQKALEAGREVWWIEDFYGVVPRAEMPRGVQFVDTAALTEYPVLLPDMVPSHLLGGKLVPFGEVFEDRPSSGGLVGKLFAFFR